jgi:hypothetical protein
MNLLLLLVSGSSLKLVEISGLWAARNGVGLKFGLLVNNTVTCMLADSIGNLVGAKSNSTHSILTGISRGFT